MKGGVRLFNMFQREKIGMEERGRFLLLGCLLGYD